MTPQPDLSTGTQILSPLAISEHGQVGAAGPDRIQDLNWRQQESNEEVPGPLERPELEGSWEANEDDALYHQVEDNEANDDFRNDPLAKKPRDDHGCDEQGKHDHPECVPGNQSTLQDAFNQDL